MGLVTSPCKTIHTTETARSNHSGIQTRQRKSLPHDDVEGGSMTDVDQSREEVFISKRRIFNAKSITKIGTWNVSTPYQSSSMAQVLREMQAYRLEVIIKLPKKRSLKDCNNWRGITVLSTPFGILI